jgi:hypothetical protein
VGPHNNPELFENVEASVPIVVEELARKQKAEQTLGELSAEFEEYPVVSPLSEPSLPAKLNALSRLNYDVMGVAGFNAMRMISLEGDVVSIEAFAAPAHDAFDVEGGGVKIETRAIMIKTPQDQRRDADNTDGDLEFFGLNLFASPQEEADDIPLETGVTSSLFIPSQEATGRLVTTKGEPLLGTTSIFAVRHKKHGTVKVYTVTLDINPMSGIEMSGITRDSLGQIQFAFPNGMKATVRELGGIEFDQAVDEFAAATRMLQFQKNIDPEKSRFSAEERAALRSIGQQASE